MQNVVRPYMMLDGMKPHTHNFHHRSAKISFVHSRKNIADRRYVLSLSRYYFPEVIALEYPQSMWLLGDSIAR
jgi:hypothetical protein